MGRIQTTARSVRCQYQHKGRALRRCRSLPPPAPVVAGSVWRHDMANCRMRWKRLDCRAPGWDR